MFMAGKIIQRNGRIETNKHKWDLPPEELNNYNT